MFTFIKLCCCLKTVRLTWEDVNESNLTGYRLLLVRKSMVNCLRMAGYEINDKAENIWLQVSTKNQNDGETGKPVVMLCGPILNAGTGRKEIEMTANEYRR